MSKQKYRPIQQRQFPVVRVMMGLLLIGFAILALVSPIHQNNKESFSSVVPVPINYAAPELSLQNINGKTESLIDYHGSVILVNNWATWCPPCKAEMPTLSA